MMTAPEHIYSNSNPSVVVGAGDQAESAPLRRSAGVTMESSSARPPGRIDGRGYAAAPAPAASLPCSDSDPVALQPGVAAAAAVGRGGAMKTAPEDNYSNSNLSVVVGVADQEESAPVLRSPTLSATGSPPSSRKDARERDRDAAPAVPLSSSDPVTTAAVAPQDRTRVHSNTNPPVAMGTDDITRRDSHTPGFLASGTTSNPPVAPASAYIDIPTGLPAPAHPPSPSLSSSYHTATRSLSPNDSSTMSASATRGPPSSGNNVSRDHDDAAPDDNEDLPNFTFASGLLAINASGLAGIVAESKDTVSDWSAGPTAVYGIFVVLSISLVAVGIMAAGRHVAVGRGTNTTTTLSLSVASFCAKLGAISCSAILIVVVCCKLGRWGCVSGVPPAVVIAGVMAAVWAWGNEHAVAQAVYDCWARFRGRGQPAGADDKCKTTTSTIRIKA